MKKLYICSSILILHVYIYNVRVCVAVQLVILTPTPTNGFCLFTLLIHFVFASTLTIWLFMS